MKTEKIIGIVELDEYGEFRDLLYEETNRIAQEKARKIDCEITKKIRQEAKQEERQRIIGILEEMMIEKGIVDISTETPEIYIKVEDIQEAITRISDNQ